MNQVLTKRRGGRPRSRKKMSPTAKYLSVNQKHFPILARNGIPNGGDWQKIKPTR